MKGGTSSLLAPTCPATSRAPKAVLKTLAAIWATLPIATNAAHAISAGAVLCRFSRGWLCFCSALPGTAPRTEDGHSTCGQPGLCCLPCWCDRRQKSPSVKISCRNGPGCTPWCGGCLWTRYGENLDEVGWVAALTALTLHSTDCRLTMASEHDALTACMDECNACTCGVCATDQWNAYSILRLPLCAHLVRGYGLEVPRVPRRLQLLLTNLPARTQGSQSHRRPQV
jgi:hypothetical protein